MTWQSRSMVLWRSGMSWTAITAQLVEEFPDAGLNRERIRGHVRNQPEYAAGARIPRPDEQPAPRDTNKRSSVIDKDGTQTSETVIPAKDEEIRDPEFLLTAHKFIPPENWELLFAKSSIYDVQLKGGTPTTFYSSRITVKPRAGVTEKDVLEHFIEQAERYSPVQTRAVKQDGEYILVIDQSDVHIGQLSWGAESGENYDSKIATSRMQALVNDSLSKAPQLDYKTVYLVLGNDFFNTDSVGNTTTAGTAQVNDVRHQKMFNMGCDLLVWFVDAVRLAFPYTPIETILVPGNHERLTMHHAAKYLYAWFRNDGSVTVDVSPPLHKGFAFGVTALLFTHGQNELKNLDWVYTEFRHLIGSTKMTEILAGHQHRIRVEEKNGALIRINPAVATLDNWTYEQGYGAVARSISRVYRKDKGLEYEIYSSA